MRILTVFLALLATQPCIAQTDDAPQRPAFGRPREGGNEGLNVTIGAATLVSPVWQGSRDMAFSIFPDLRINYEDVIFASIPDGLGWNAVNQDGWKAGPLGKIRFGRDEQRGGSPFLIAGTSDALLGLGNINAAFELGGFVEKRAGPLRGRIELRRGFGGHRGVVAEGSVAYQARVGRTMVNIGPRATVASKAFVDTYFGIDAEQSQRSGLGIYSASGGLLSYGVGASVIRPLDQRSALTFFTSVDRLGSAAGDSPLVRERGRKNQFTVGLGYGFRFRLF